MPERRDRVAISTTRTTIELPWSSRDQLLDEIRNLDDAEPIRTAFEAVGRCSQAWVSSESARAASCLQPEPTIGARRAATLAWTCCCAM